MGEAIDAIAIVPRVALDAFLLSALAFGICGLLVAPIVSKWKNFPPRG